MQPLIRIFRKGIASQISRTLARVMHHRSPRSGPRHSCRLFLTRRFQLDFRRQDQRIFRLFILVCDEARSALAFGAAQCVTMIAEIELRIIHKACESLDDLHRHGIGFVFGLCGSLALQPLCEDLFGEVVPDRFPKHIQFSHLTFGQSSFIDSQFLNLSFPDARSADRGCYITDHKRLPSHSSLTKSKKEGRYTIGNLGNFTITKRPARKDRNPRMGEAIRIKASKALKFRPAAALKRAAGT